MLHKGVLSESHHRMQISWTRRLGEVQRASALRLGCSVMGIRNPLVPWFQIQGPDTGQGDHTCPLEMSPGQGLQGLVVGALGKAKKLLEELRPHKELVLLEQDASVSSHRNQVSLHIPLDDVPQKLYFLASWLRRRRKKMEKEQEQ